MANKQKLQDLLKQRTTLPQREAIEPVNLYKVKEKTEKPNERTERGNDTSERLDRTVKLQTSVLEEIKEGIKDDKRPTERYSFEIYTDQKQEIEDLQYRYKKKTGNKLSASRIIREALEVYLKQAISTLKG